MWSAGRTWGSVRGRSRASGVQGRARRAAGGARTGCRGGAGRGGRGRRRRCAGEAWTGVAGRRARGARAGADPSPASLNCPLTRRYPGAGRSVKAWFTGAGRPLRGSRSGSSGALLACGRAPGRALWPGPYGSACMGAAWVGPSRWTLRAGGNRRLIPRRRWTGPGGELCLPDCTSAPSRAARRNLRRVGRETGAGVSGRARAGGHEADRRNAPTRARVRGSCGRPLGSRVGAPVGARSGVRVAPANRSRTLRRPAAARDLVRCGREQNGRYAHEGSHGLPVIRFQGALRLAECRPSGGVGPAGSRTSRRLPERGYAPWPDPGPGGGTCGRGQQAESVTPLLPGTTRAGDLPVGAAGSPAPAFARGACAHDVRRP